MPDTRTLSLFISLSLSLQISWPRKCKKISDPRKRQPICKTESEKTTTKKLKIHESNLYLLPSIFNLISRDCSDHSRRLRPPSPPKPSKSIKHLRYDTEPETNTEIFEEGRRFADRENGDRDEGRKNKKERPVRARERSIQSSQDPKQKKQREWKNTNFYYFEDMRKKK